MSRDGVKSIADTRAEEIRKLVAKGESGRAVKRTMDFARDFVPGSEAAAIELARRSDPAVRTPGDINKDIVSLLEKLESAAVKSPGEPAGERPGAAPVFTGGGIDRIYRSRRKKGFRINLDIEIELAPGEITGLVGKNGSGKTTLLRIIAGELAADGGDLRYLFNSPGEPDWQAVRKRIAHVPQRPNKWHGILEQNLRYAAAMHGINGARNKTVAEFFMYRQGLAELRDAKWSELTGGFLTRFELARAMVRDPDILILDEPLAPLDIGAMQVFLQDITDLATSARRPLPVIVSSQHIYEIESIADRLLVLDGGRPKFYGTLNDLREKGEEREYEIQCMADMENVEKALEDITVLGISGVGNKFAVRVPNEVAGNDLLSRIIEAGIQVDYFRDISESTRKMFDEGRRS